MNLRLYVASCAEQIQELESLLSEDDIKDLAAFLRNFSFSKYANWVYSNQNLVEEFLSLTPSARKKKKYLNMERMTRLALILACIQRAFSARALLRALDESPLEEGYRYREMCLQASRVYLQSTLEAKNSLRYWSFGDVCDNPFDS